jgi:hypothetical protein
MGLTLIEAAKYESRLEHLAVIKTFAEGELLSWLPFMNIAGGGLFYSVEKELPSVGFRAVNEGYKQSYGVVDPQSEAVHLFGGDVDVDRSIVDLQGPEARAAQTEMKVRSMRLTLEAALINGDATASQGRGFDGLAKRLSPGSEMALNNGGLRVHWGAYHHGLECRRRVGPRRLNPPLRWPQPDRPSRKRFSTVVDSVNKITS